MGFSGNLWTTKMQCSMYWCIILGRGSIHKFKQFLKACRSSRSWNRWRHIPGSADTCFVCVCLWSAFLPPLPASFSIPCDLSSSKSRKVFKKQLLQEEKCLSHLPSYTNSHFFIILVLAQFKDRDPPFFLTMGIITHLNVRISFMQFHRKPKS